MGGVLAGAVLDATEQKLAPDAVFGFPWAAPMVSVVIDGVRVELKEVLEA